MDANVKINEMAEVIALTPVQSGCCAPAVVAPAPVVATLACCEPGNVATVVNPAGQTVSACCGKPVNAASQSSACCG